MNDALKFKRVDRAGFRFGAACSLGGTAGGLGTNQIWSLGAGYEQGPLSLGAGYLNVRRPNFSFFGKHRTSSPTASNLTASTVYADYASASTQQIIAAWARSRRSTRCIIRARPRSTTSKRTSGICSRRR
ncbi:hypothetical protein [Burkholderia glumae]|uniref:hypothetical protein n=1 Tax=Burkholderia glumae TaxID=337 RepID=UPI00203756BC|nr:hypothetical protein [Burkholderia glumae]MCM2552304.1 hypothetical protein [Burkholderia glumae]